MGQRLFANPLQITDICCLLPLAFSAQLECVFLLFKNTKENGRFAVKRKFAEKKRTHGKASCTSPVVNSVLSVFDLAVCKRWVIGKCEKGVKDLSPIRCKQQTLSPVAVKISGTT